MRKILLWPKWRILNMKDNNFVKNPQKSMQNRFNFTGLDLSTVNNFQLPQGPSSNPKPLEVTQVGGQQQPLSIIQELPLVTKHFLTHGSPSTAYQISFEKGFMIEHRAVFARELQNYMESARSFLQEKDPTLLRRFPEGICAVGSGMNFEEVIQMTGTEGEESRSRNQFVREVRQREKLEEFLNIVADSCPCQVASELLDIANQLLIGYTLSEHSKNPHVQAEELLELAEEIRGRLTGIKVIDLRFLQGDSKSLERKYRRFMEVFCGTVMLVIGQFFENPYSGGERVFKRALSPFSLEDNENDMDGDADGEMHMNPLKRRKFSF